VKQSTFLRVPVAVACLALAGPSSAHGVADDELPSRLPLWQTTIVEYRWTFLTPVWIVEPRAYETRVTAPRMRPRTVEIPSLEWTSERRKVARVADFDCKYGDFLLPNACTTTWRDVYVDVPVAVVRRDSIDIDVPQWTREQWRTTVDAPRLVWREETLVVSLPAIAVTQNP
jgi:hypothetical protein